MNGTRRQNPLLAWHASPYDLPAGKFGPMEETSGRGQGAASYGRGAAYLAENPKVSGPGESEYMREFQNHPSARGRAARWSHNGEVLEDQSRDVPGTTIRHIYAAETPQEFVRRWLTAYPKVNIFPRGVGISGILRDLQNIVDEDAHSGVSGQKVKDALKWLKNRKNAAQFKRVDEPAGPFSYKVAMHLGDDTLLDWDKRMDQHPDGVVQKLETLGFQPNDAGSDFYSKLTQRHGSDFAASKALYNAGIHGIRYKDAGSRQQSPPRLMIDGEPYDPKKHGDEGGTVNGWLHGMKPSTTLDDVMEEMRSAQVVHGNSVYGKYLAAARKWMKANKDRLALDVPKPTYNYVVFHPDFIEALEQYDIHGKRVKAFAPKGVKLKSVDHDPFDGEGK